MNKLHYEKVTVHSNNTHSSTRCHLNKRKPFFPPTLPGAFIIKNLFTQIKENAPRFLKTWVNVKSSSNEKKDSSLKLDCCNADYN